MATAVWPGTVGAYARLLAAVNRNCTCTDAEQRCPAHLMLTDQALLNHLAFAEQLAPKLERQEWVARPRRA